MLFSTIGQIHIFLWMIGAGMLIGALYALCAGLRLLMRAGFWLTLAIDVMFGLISGVVLIAAVLFASYGSVRLYELLGAAVGMILFSLGVRPPLEALFRAAGKLLRRTIRKSANFRLIKVIFR